MLALGTDENFNNDIVRGVLRRETDANRVRIQDAGLSGADDAVVLEWAAQQRRVLFTHDASTMIHHAYERVRTGKSMPGVFEANREVLIAQAIEDILVLAECSREAEWEGQVRYLPLR